MVIYFTHQAINEVVVEYIYFFAPYTLVFMFIIWPMNELGVSCVERFFIFEILHTLVLDDNYFDEQTKKHYHQVECVWIICRFIEDAKL